MYIALTGRRRYITRGEAVDLTNQDGEDEGTSVDYLLSSPPPTPPSRRQPPQTPPSGKSRRHVDRSPGSLSPSTAPTRRRPSPQSSPRSTSRRANTLGTPGQPPAGGDMNRYGSFSREQSTPGLGRSMTADGGIGYKYYPSYLDTRLAELDPTRTPSQRQSRRDSSSSESSIHGSATSIHSDGSVMETPPRSPIDLQKTRSFTGRPRSWCDPQTLQSQNHLSSESPTAFPFAASSYENLDKDGGTENILGRSNTVGALGTARKDSGSNLTHAQSFGGHENRSSISPRPVAGSAPYVVAKHFPGGKSASWQPSVGVADFGTSPRSRFVSDGNIRRSNAESGIIPDPTLRRAGSGESDASSITSATSLPPFPGARGLGSETQEVALVSRRPLRDRMAKERSVDSAASEPTGLQCVETPDGGIQYVQFSPRKARPFGNRAQTVELSQISRSPNTSPGVASSLQRATHKSSSVREKARHYDKKADSSSIPASGIIGQYEGVTFPADYLDADRRPSLSETVDKNILYKERRMKELAALPGLGVATSQPKRALSFDTMGIRSPLYRTEAPSLNKEKMLHPTYNTMGDRDITSVGTPETPKSPRSKRHGIITESVLGVHKPLLEPEGKPASSTSSSSSSKSSGFIVSSASQTEHLVEAASPAEPKSPIRPVPSLPWERGYRESRINNSMTSSQPITSDITKSAFKPFVKNSEPKLKDKSKLDEKISEAKPLLLPQDAVEDREKAKSSSLSPYSAKEDKLKQAILEEWASGKKKEKNIPRAELPVTKTTDSVMTSSISTKSQVTKSVVSIPPVSLASHVKTYDKTSSDKIMNAPLYVEASPSGDLLSSVPINPKFVASTSTDSIGSSLSLPRGSKFVGATSPDKKSTSLMLDIPSARASHSSKSSSSASPKLSSHHLGLWEKTPSPSREYYDPTVEDEDDASMRRGISQESIQSAMAVLDDAIAMLHSVAKSSPTTPVTTTASVSVAPTATTADNHVDLSQSGLLKHSPTTPITAAPVTTTAANHVDLSQSGLLKYSSHTTLARPVITSCYASMPLFTDPVTTGSSLVKYHSMPPGETAHESTQLVSSVKPVMSSAPEKCQSSFISEIQRTCITGVPEKGAPNISLVLPDTAEKTKFFTDKLPSPISLQRVTLVPASNITSFSLTGISTSPGNQGPNGTKDPVEAITLAPTVVETPLNLAQITIKAPVTIAQKKVEASLSYAQTSLEKPSTAIQTAPEAPPRQSLATKDFLFGAAKDLLTSSEKSSTGSLSSPAIVLADTSQLDQILASMQAETLKARSKTDSQPKPAVEKTKKSEKGKKAKLVDRDKSLDEIEARRRMVTREDSFNQNTDSEPDESLMALPRDSVILRHRYHIKEDVTSSSDSSSPATPRLSPRVMRRHKKAGSDSSADPKKRTHLGVPSKHRAGKELSDLPTSDGRLVSPHADLARVPGLARDMASPSTTGTYHTGPSGTPPNDVTWSTPPTTPQLPRTGHVAGHVNDVMHQAEGVYSVSAGVVGRPGSAGLPSDSSSVTSRRRRFRIRDQDTIEEGVPSVAIRPGKKDKSLQRKSTLNQPGPDGLDHRMRDSDFSSSSSEAPTRRRSGQLSPQGSIDGGTSPSAKQTHKSGIFTLGKAAKKDAKPSALGALISQTAMLGPAMAHGLGPREGYTALHQEVSEPHSPPPVDPTTKVKAVTPISAHSLEIPVTDQYPQHRGQHHSPTHAGSLRSPSVSLYHEPVIPQPPAISRSFSPTHGHPLSGKMSPPPGVPMMGSQMIRKQQQGSLTSIPSSLQQSGTSLATTSVVTTTTVSMTTTSAVVTTPSSVMSSSLRSSHGSINSITKDSFSKPIASPKLIKTTKLKPLSEAMSLTQVPTEASRNTTTVQKTTKPFSPSDLQPACGTSPAILEPKLHPQHAPKADQKPVPLISQQQFQGVETVAISAARQPHIVKVTSSPTIKAQQHESVETVMIGQRPSLEASAQTNSSTNVSSMESSAPNVVVSSSKAGNSNSAPSCSSGHDDHKAPSVVSTTPTRTTQLSGTISSSIEISPSVSSAIQKSVPPRKEEEKLQPIQPKQGVTVIEQTVKGASKQDAVTDLKDETGSKKSFPPTKGVTSFESKTSVFVMQTSQERKDPNIEKYQPNIEPVAQQPSTSKITSSTGQTSSSTGQTTPSTSEAMPSAGQTPASTGQLTPSTGKVESSTSQTLSVTGKTAPSIGQTTPSIGQTTPSIGQTTPSISQTQPATTKTTPSTGQTTSVTDKTMPSIKQTTPSIDQTQSVAGKTAPARSSQPGQKKAMVMKNIVKQRAIVSEVESPQIGRAQVLPPPVLVNTTVTQPRPQHDEITEGHSETPAQLEHTEVGSEETVSEKLGRTEAVKSPSSSADTSAESRVIQEELQTDMNDHKARESLGAIDNAISVRPDAESIKKARPLEKVASQDIAGMPKVVPGCSALLKRSASVPIQKRGILRPTVTEPDVGETKLVILSVLKLEDEANQSEPDLDFETPPTTPTSSKFDLSEVSRETENQDKLKDILECDTTTSDNKASQRSAEESSSSEVLTIKQSYKLQQSLPISNSTNEKDSQHKEYPINPSDMHDTEHGGKVSVADNVLISPLTVCEAAVCEAAASVEPQSVRGLSVSSQTVGDTLDNSLGTADREKSEASTQPVDAVVSSETPQSGDADEAIVPSGAPVLDKIAAWQKHLTQGVQSSMTAGVQSSMTQAHRQAVLRERRGLGIWSSGDSITDTVTVLTPISEEQKSTARQEAPPGSGEDEESVSVLERIRQMEVKQDEDRFTLTRPSSGFTTPRLKVLRPKGSPLRCSFTPHAHTIATSPLETDERSLLAKLSQVADIAMVRDAACEKRKRFMQRHGDDRRRTQPVTLNEIREADSLESVNSFRAEVLRKSSLNVFEAEKESLRDFSQHLKHIRGQETFPTHIKHEKLKERRKDGSRYKTLPVTQTELNQIPESETVTFTQKPSSVKTLRQRLEEMEKMDSLEDVLDSKEAKIDSKVDKLQDKTKSISVMAQQNEDRYDAVKNKVLQQKREEALCKSKETLTGKLAGKPNELQMSVSKMTELETSVSKLPNPQGLPSKQKESQISVQSVSVKTVAMTTCTTATSTTAVSSMSDNRITPARLAKLDVADDELDQLVAINYKEISSHKRKHRQAQADAKRSEQEAIQRDTTVKASEASQALKSSMTGSVTELTQGKNLLSKSIEASPTKTAAQNLSSLSESQAGAVITMATTIATATKQTVNTNMTPSSPKSPLLISQSIGKQVSQHTNTPQSSQPIKAITVEPVKSLETASESLKQVGSHSTKGKLTSFGVQSKVDLKGLPAQGKDEGQKTAEVETQIKTTKLQPKVSDNKQANTSEIKSIQKENTVKLDSSVKLGENIRDSSQILCKTDKTELPISKVTTDAKSIAATSVIKDSSKVVLSSKNEPTPGKKIHVKTEHSQTCDSKSVEILSKSSLPESKSSISESKSVIPESKSVIQESKSVIPLAIASLRLSPQPEQADRIESSPSMDRDVSTTDTEGPEDDLSKLSVSEKLQLFRKLDKTARSNSDKQHRRFADRKKRFVRSQTLPDDVSDTREKDATNLDDTAGQGAGVSQATSVGNLTQVSEVAKEASAMVTVAKEASTEVTMEPETTKESAPEGATDSEVKDTEDDELSKLTLAEKVRLFSQKHQVESPQKRDAAVIRRKNRRTQSRFKTQSMEEPITVEEVEKARISPLAMSLIKPPDPDILQVLSVRDQREVMAQWAEAALSDMGSRSGSRPSSVVLDEVTTDTRPMSGGDSSATRRTSDGDSGATRRTSDGDSGADEKRPKGILKPPESQPAEVRSILKPAHSGGESSEVRSILKTDGATSEGEHDRKPASILKHDVTHTELETSVEPHPILKKDSQHETSTKLGDSHSILKKDSVHLKKDWAHLELGAPIEPHPILKKDTGHHEAVNRLDGHGILKRDSVQLKKELTHPAADNTVSGVSENTHGILKRDSPSHDAKHEMRGILKKESSFEAKSEPERSVLKKRDSCGDMGDVSGRGKTDVNANKSLPSEPERGVLRKTSSVELHIDSQKKSSKDMDSNMDNCAFHEHRSMDMRNISEKMSSVTKEIDETVALEIEGSVGQIRTRVKSDHDVPRMPVSSDLTPKTGANVSRSRSARVGRHGDSSTEDDSSTSSERMSWVKNSAVAKRRMKQVEEKKVHKLQLPAIFQGSSTPSRHSISADIERKLHNHPSSKENGFEARSTLHKALEKSYSSPEKTPTATDPAVVKLRENKSDRQRPRSIADRLTMLKDSQDDWRTKVEDKDVSKFTVEGKLNMAGLTPNPDSPFAAQKRLHGTPGKFPLKRAQSSPNLLLVSESSSDSDSERQPNKVKVTRPDEEGFSGFFSTHSNDLSKVEVTVDDFDHIFMESNDILQTTKKLRPQRRQPGSRNPLKKLAARDDLQQEYEEVKTNVAERELRRIKREQIAGTAHIAQEALAGLASKENFSKVNLRKADSSGSSTPGMSNLPYKDIMLLHVKGRRHCQTRLVAPASHSINSGDCFLLVIPDRVYVWQGEYSNIIERSRAAELASTICQKKDLGYKAPHEPVLVMEGKQTMMSNGERFWEILGGMKQYQPPGPVEEDELYEMYMAESIRIYGLKGDELIMLESGCLPTYEMLNSKQTLVFDFGSELYVWTGKQVPVNERQKGIRLAKQIWDKGYNYENYDINPMSPLCSEEDSGIPVKADKRPDWALFGKVSENMETILFKEKFVDWPDAAKIIKVKGQDDEQKEEAPELVSYDVTKMLPIDTKPVTLLLETSNVGRGKSWMEVQDGIRREFEIKTLGVVVFHILEYDHLKLDSASHGQFHDHDTYVIRWHFMISQTGMRNIRTQEQRSATTGRERYAYFFWQGQHSTITEKGASALMTVELDEERGPQVRVTQGKEPPCFLQLFRGHMIVHIGKREDESTNTSGVWRLYVVRCELPDEAYLMEVPCRMSSLRSRASMLLLNIKTGILHVWHGSKSASHTRQRALSIARALEKHCPAEVGLHANVQVITCEVSEGSEKSDFLVAMDTRERVYHSLLKDPTPMRHSPRLFYTHSVCGEFIATEIINSTRNNDKLCCPFPFSQSDLYSSSQPGLFLLDNHQEVFLWQGWWPEEKDDAENVRTGSAESRFSVDRRLAVETTLNYCKAKNPESPPKAWLVFAGLEPVKFTNLFPVWEVNEEAQDSNLKERRSEGQIVPLDELLKKLQCTCYTFAELQERPLPEGVDPLKLEFYLDENEFKEIVKMSKEEFYALPAWKQNNIKKEVALF